MNDNAFQMPDSSFIAPHSVFKKVLFVSPHLDDAAFSCGGTMIEMARKNRQTILCNIFTASVENPQGFALACQTDKGLSPAIDYMKLRRAEDAEFARIANVSQTFNLDFREAPHRGYDSAPELFAGVHENDEIWREIAVELEKLIAETAPDAIFAPQGIGNHVDHLQTIRAVLASVANAPIFWYRDTPYVVRNPDAAPSELLPPALIEQKIGITNSLETKIKSCCAYATQINFQFGGAKNLAKSLREFHRAESAPNETGEFAEKFLTNGGTIFF